MNGGRWMFMCDALPTGRASTHVWAGVGKATPPPPHTPYPGLLPAQSRGRTHVVEGGEYGSCRRPYS